MPREGGAPSNRKARFCIRASVITGSSAFADDDSGVFGGALPYRLSLKNSFNSAAALVSPTAE
jgi:hypothetical protein